MTSRLTIAIPLTERRSWLLLLHQCAIGAAAIAVATLLAYKLQFPLATVGFIYLLAVVVTSLIYGIWQATFVSLVAVSCLNYFFIVPVLSFSVADPRDWIALVSFQICALVISRLSSREQQIARDANQQRFHMAKLYELSRGILLFDLGQAPGPQLAQAVRRILLADAVAVFDANLVHLDYEGSWLEEDQQIAKTTYFLGKNEDHPDIHLTQRVINSGSSSLGAMAIRGDVDALIADAVASLAAIAFERYRSYANEASAESAKQAEQLRVAVLDALAHAFKTPLTVIRTASCGLLEMGTLDKEESELAGLIDEESVNLNNLCTQLLQTAKLEASRVILHTESVIVSQLVNEVVNDLALTLKGHPIELSIEEQPLPVRGDRGLLEMILTQYLDNAAKYSSPETPIAITVRESDSELMLSVRNQGSVIEMQEREKVFERFYRSPVSKEKTAGAGLGLSIAKKAAEAHRGHVWVISGKEEGTTFFLAMPKDQTGGY